MMSSIEDVYAAQKLRRKTSKLESGRSIINKIMKVKVQSTVYPKGYDKKGNSDRYHKRFARNFNQWGKDIREATLPEEVIMNARLKEATKLINI